MFAEPEKGLFVFRPFFRLHYSVLLQGQLENTCIFWAVPSGYEVHVPVEMQLIPRPCVTFTLCEIYALLGPFYSI